ncbi:hypothetical protein [Nocardia asteroides]|uniref:hypothetical protein n=1 Tax=Nocardia asteroides TaxID=1824 RepID=UPI001E2AF042|nr:hypothetical protein [Nocardia asteroides]UGT63352.1 hypothetical protein LTT61_08595 [Nocardia asteroides]
MEPDLGNPHWTAIVGGNWPAVAPAEWNRLAGIAEAGAAGLDPGAAEQHRRTFEERVRSSAGLRLAKDELLRQRGTPQAFADALLATAAVLRDFADLVYRTRNRILDIVDRATARIATAHRCAAAAEDETAANEQRARIPGLIAEARDEVDEVARAALRETGPSGFPGLQIIAELLGMPGPWVPGRPGAVPRPGRGHRPHTGGPGRRRDGWPPEPEAGPLPVTFPPPIPSTASPLPVVPVEFGDGHPVPVVPSGLEPASVGGAGPVATAPGAPVPSGAGFGPVVTGSYDRSGGGPGGEPHPGAHTGDELDRSVPVVAATRSGPGERSVGFDPATLAGGPGAEPADPARLGGESGSGAVPFGAVPAFLGRSGATGPGGTGAAVAGTARAGAPGAAATAAAGSPAGGSGATQGASAGRTGGPAGTAEGRNLAGPPRVSAGQGGPAPSAPGPLPPVPRGRSGRGSDDLIRETVGAAMLFAAEPSFVLGERVDGDLVLARTLLAGILAATPQVLGTAWAVAVLRRPSGVSAFVTSNEGRGWLPAGLYLPREVSTPWVWEIAEGFAWEGIADPARVLAEFGLALGRRSGARLSALASSERIGPALRGQLGEVALAGEVPASAGLDLGVAGPGLTDRLGLTGAPALLERAAAVPEPELAARCLSAALDAHTGVGRRRLHTPEALDAPALRLRILTALRQQQPVPERWWAELRDTDDLIAAAVPARRADVARIPLGELRAENRDAVSGTERAALRALAFQRRCDELVLLLAGPPDRQRLRDAIYAHAQVAGHPAYAARTGIPTAGNR